MEDYKDIFEEFLDEFHEAPQPDEERFTIDTDAKAEWAIRKIAEEEAESDRLIGCCQDAINRYLYKQEEYKAKCERRTANLRAMLLIYFGTVEKKETKTQQKYSLPSGSLILKKASSDFDADKDKLREWLVKNEMTAYLKTEVSAKWADVKKQLIRAEDGSIIFSETGEIIPEGVVTIADKPERFEVKPL